MAFGQQTASVNSTIRLPAEEVKRLFKVQLSILIDGMFVAHGKVWTEEYTSHRFEVEVGSASDPKFRVVVAAIELRDALTEKGFLP